MSSVRMCDRCGSIFSENEDGWQTFTGSTVRRQSDGSRKMETVSMDACRACAFQQMDAPPPSLPSPSSDPSVFHLTEDPKSEAAAS